MNLRASATWLLTAVAFGCVLACGPEPESEPEREPNRAPRVVADAARVSGQFTDYVELQSACDAWFEVIVDDPDVDDRLEFRWYVTRLDPSSERRTFAAGYLQNTGAARRPPVRISLKSDPAMDPLAEPGLYHVQFMVTDGRLLPNQGPGDVPEPEVGSDGELSARHADYFTWTVRVVAGDCDAENP